MVQFHILSGKKAGARMEARRFPFHIGRAAGNDLELDDNGVWDRHVSVEFDPQSGFRLASAPEAIVAVNGAVVKEQALRNGDVITAGSARIQFWLAAARQGNLRLRENAVWALITLVTIAQFVLLYWLVR